MIPVFPDFTPIALELKPALSSALRCSPDGVSEFTFSNLYLFRRRYNYKISREHDGNILVSGERDGKKFFSTPCATPKEDVLQALFAKHDYWKGIPDSILGNNLPLFEKLCVNIAEDRDNFDYLYNTSDLALLSGKKFHKKRNLVNAFLLSHPNHDEKPLTAEYLPQAVTILERWRQDKGSDGDYIAALEALELAAEMELEGLICFVNKHPAGYCLGEYVAGGTMFAIHFEKGIDEYKGIYQAVNQFFAASLPPSCLYINREQDLGDEGLRQSKMTYRPCGFVKKYTGTVK
jgi:hypothetical protein